MYVVASPLTFKNSVWCLSRYRYYGALKYLFSGRGGYHRSASYSDEHGGENRSGGFPYYGRGGGAAGNSGGGDHWAPADGGTGAGRGAGGAGGGGGGAYTPTGPPVGGGSRASRDGNWRSPTTPQTEDAATTSEWGSHWHPPPSPASTCIYIATVYVVEIFWKFSFCRVPKHERFWHPPSRTLSIILTVKICQP